MITSFNCSHKLKAKGPMLVTFSGISTAVNLEPLNAPPSIFSKERGN